MENQNSTTNSYLTTKELSQRWKVNPKVLYSLESIIEFENKNKAQNTLENKLENN